MIESATAINTLRTSTEADFVPPSEQLITLTYGQLKDLIAHAIEKAIQPLQDRISALETLEEIYHGPAPQPEDIPLVRECWNTKRDIINDLPSRVWSIEEDLSKMEETRETTCAPTATETDRIERIEKLCQDTPGHIISLSELRGRLGIDKAVLSRLLKKIDREKFYLKKASHDKRVRYLCQRPEVR